jgi:hypothetical protein
MNETRLIETLKTFKKGEWKHFEKFVASPFFNKGRNYLPLIKLLQPFYPEFDSEKLSYEFLHKKLYSGKAFNKQMMWNLASELEKLTKEFMLQTAFKNERLARFTILFDELDRRKLDKLCLKEIQEAEKILKSINLGAEYFNSKRIIEDHQVKYWNSIKGRPDKGFGSIIKETEYLILDFLVGLSAQVWDLHVMKMMYNASDKTNVIFEFVKNLDLKKIVDYAEESKYKYAPVMMFYYNKIMCALFEDEESYFLDMKSFFDENYNVFDIKEQKNIIITLANYCAFKMRLGQESYVRILFEINKFRLEKGIAAYGNGRITKALYHQVLRNALSLNEVEWAESFVKEYTPILNTEHQKTMEALAYGYIYHVKKDYRKVLLFLNKVEFIDIRDKLHVRILSSKSYYELGETELLIHYIDSSKHFISSNDAIETETREAYLKFFKYLEKLVLFKNGSDEFAVRKLKETIDNDKTLRLRHGSWFNEKINELEKRTAGSA